MQTGNQVSPKIDDVKLVATDLMAKRIGDGNGSRRYICNECYTSLRRIVEVIFPGGCSTDELQYLVNTFMESVKPERPEYPPVSLSVLESFVEE